MDKNEILEKNRSSKGEDEREVFVNGKASLAAKSAFSFVAVALILYKMRLGLNTEDIWLVWFAYFTIETIYKYYHLRKKSLLIWSIIFLSGGILAAVSIFTKGL